MNTFVLQITGPMSRRDPIHGSSINLMRQNLGSVDNSRSLLVFIILFIMLDQHPSHCKAPRVFPNKETKYMEWNRTSAVEVGQN